MKTLRHLLSQSIVPRTLSSECNKRACRTQSELAVPHCCEWIVNWNGKIEIDPETLPPKRERERARR